MKTVTLQATIAPNGTIHLDIPSDLPPGPAEVTVTIQPTAEDALSPSGTGLTGSEAAEPLGEAARGADLESRGLLLQRALPRQALRRLRHRCGP